MTATGTEPPAPPSSRRPPLPVLVAGGAVAATLLGDQMLYAVMPATPGAWGLSIAAVGVLLSANRLVRLLTNPVAAVLFHRLGPTVPFGGALVLAVAVTLVYGWATAFWLLLLARMTWGLAWSMLRLGGEWTVLDEAHDGNRGYLLGAYHSITQAGSMLGVLAGGLLADAIGHRATLTIFAGLTAVAGAAWAATSRRRQRGRPEASRPLARPDIRAGFAEVIRDGRLLLVSITGLAAALTLGGVVGSALGFYFRAQFGDTVTLTGLAIGAASLTGLALGTRSLLLVALNPVAGALSDRIGRVRGVVAGLLVAVAGLALLAVAGSVPVVLLGLAVVFVATPVVAVQLLAAAGDLATPERRGPALAVYATFLDLGAAVGPLVGLVPGSLEALRAVFAAGALLLAVLAVAYPRVMARSHARHVAAR